MMTFWMSMAAAAPWAEVDAVWEDGREVRESSLATVDGEAIRRGMDLQAGDVLEVGPNAQVRVLYDTGDQVVIYQDTTVTLGEKSLVQEFGALLLEVEGAWKVLYGEVEAAVEGTRFTVSESEGAVTVRVAEGAVRVSNGQGSVLVGAGESTTVTDAPSVPAEEARWTPDGLGPPRTQVGVMGGGAWLLGAPHAEVRGLVRRRLTPGWQVAASIGFESSGGRFHLPLAAGVERRFWRTAVGLEGTFLVGPETTCNQTRTVVKPGAVAVGRVIVARPGPLEIAVSGRVGWLSGLRAEGGLEVGLAL